ncbi:MAG TPA: arsenosugar biosynthesis radical SAM (seleno)protein ArsS [Candidatus Dormibacteraeota bacterium]|nr:arsenosugar biosynthesis radical SAM (seleno)protein ArsS [Candidatus Dormibacteraeota bacterium]
MDGAVADVEADAAAAPRTFAATLARHGLAPLARRAVDVLQVNLGARCNQACRHCHVDAGPTRTETMSRATAARVVELLAASPGTGVVDLTGGAPELNASFAYLVERARGLGRHVIDRCNLTVLLEPDCEWVAEFLRDHEVEIVCSLPCYTAATVDAQRGRGVFDKSVAALRWLNRLGYGQPGSPLSLTLVYNPSGASLPPSQATLEGDYRRVLRAQYGIEFTRLYALTNMPIKRFADQLARSGEYDTYLTLLREHFNPGAAAGVMCRTLVSVGWDGALYDCDFNQMLALHPPGDRRTIFDIDCLDELAAAPIATGTHCFGCTAGPGSSCGGALT